MSRKILGLITKIQNICGLLQLVPYKIEQKIKVSKLKITLIGLLPGCM